MERYVVRKPRIGADYPQGNQMIAFSADTGGNNMISPDNIYYTPYNTEFPNMQHMTSSGYIGVPMTAPSSFAPPANLLPQGQMMSGIDPRYLVGYSDNTAQFIVTGQQMQMERSPIQANQGFGSGYHNRSFMGADRNKLTTFTPQVLSSEPPRQEVAKPKEFNTQEGQNYKVPDQNQKGIQKNTNVLPITVTPKRPTEVELPKNEVQNQVMTRSDKFQALYKSGPRAFSGPVEKVLKWHKSLQDIGVLVLYEIVAKCVSVRPGDSCAKNLVVRDENGPAIQIVYYEIDFLLPELKLPCTVRVIGRMLAGTCRFQAFNVRLATGDDVATLPRRAAVAAHHVAKLCKEYGKNALNCSSTPM